MNEDNPAMDDIMPHWTDEEIDAYITKGVYDHPPRIGLVHTD